MRSHTPTLLLALTLTACGDSGSSETTGDTRTTEGSTSEAPPTTAIPTSDPGTPTTTLDATSDVTGEVTTDPGTGPVLTTDESTSTTLDTSSSTTTTTTTDSSTTSSTTSDTSTSDTSTGDPDAIAPVLTLTRPLDGAYVPMRIVPLRGHASDDQTVTDISLSVDDGPPAAIAITPGPDVDFTAPVTLHRGWNKLTVRALDAAANVHAQTVEIHLGVPIAGGGAHSLALIDDVPHGFGRNNEGQLGIGDTTDRHTPVALAGPAQLVSLAANLNHSLALDLDGTVHAWGRNDEQQIGKGPGADALLPLPVAGLADVVAISAGQRHSLALTADGTVWSWGSNADGQLGRAGEPGTAAPVPGLTDVVAIAGGGAYSLAATESGAVWAWGDNADGQLGDGGKVSSPIPLLIAEPGTIQVAIGKAHSLALAADGTALSWGLDAQGQLGDGVASSDDTVLPAAVLALENALVVAASGNHSVAYADDGILWVWGANFSGQLGLGDLLDRPTPAPTDILDIRAVAPGLAHTLVRKADGTTWVWGLNSFGQLGDANQGTNSTVPLQVTP